MGDESVENPIMLDEEENKENAPPPTTIVQEQVEDFGCFLLQHLVTK